jgi:hypothetical protein
VSIFATLLSIEDERQWIAGLQSQGIDAGVIRDGGPDFDDLDAPIVYQGSHVLPEESDFRAGSLDLAAIPPHVRFWRENPDADVEDEPGYPDACEPFLRMSLEAHESTYGGGGDATVLLTIRQATRLRDALDHWLDWAGGKI